MAIKEWFYIWTLKHLSIQASEPMSYVQKGAFQLSINKFIWISVP